MANMNIENGLKLLEELTKQQEQNKLRENLSNLYKEMGYTAISEQILNNRKPKENALYGLKMFIKDKKANRYDVNTRKIVWSCPPELEEKLNWFESQVKKVIDMLEGNNDKQRQYMELKLNYDNAYYNYSAKLSHHDDFMKELDRKSNDNWREELRQFSEELSKLEEIKKDTENKLDNFVMSNL